MARKRKLNTAPAEFEMVDEDFIEPSEYIDELNKSVENDDINYDDDVGSELEGIGEVEIPELEIEYYVSGSQSLFDGNFKPGDAVPERLVRSFYLDNGHISRRVRRKPTS
jgi:hypothetical protein